MAQKYTDNIKYGENFGKSGFGLGGLMQLITKPYVTTHPIISDNSISQCFNINDTMNFFYVHSKTGLANSNNIEKQCEYANILENITENTNEKCEYANIFNHYPVLKRPNDNILRPYKVRNENNITSERARKLYGNNILYTENYIL